MAMESGSNPRPSQLKRPSSITTEISSRTSLICTPRLRAQSSSASMDGNGIRLQPQTQRPTTAPTPTRPLLRTKLALIQETTAPTPTLLPSPRSQPRLLTSHTQTTQESPTESRVKFTPLHERNEEDAEAKK